MVLVCFEPHEEVPLFVSARLPVSAKISRGRVLFCLDKNHVKYFSWITIVPSWYTCQESCYLFLYAAAR